MERFIKLVKNKDATVTNGYGLPPAEEQEIVALEHIKGMVEKGILETVDGQYFMSPDREVWFIRYGQGESRVDEEALELLGTGAQSQGDHKRKFKRKGVVNDLVRRTKENDG